VNLPRQLPQQRPTVYVAASLLTALPLNGHFVFTGSAMVLTTAIKLRQPKRVPSHFIDFDVIVLVLFCL
jgi:hypothetical protein